MMGPVADRQYERVRFQLSEMEHRYGGNVHILSDPLALSLLARLCSEQTTQPAINELVTALYQQLLTVVVNAEFPTQRRQVRTRTAAMHPEAVVDAPLVDPETPVVSVNLARAGTLPSHVCYSALNYLMNPRQVRQDHISIGRTTDEQEKVTGSRVSGHKIGGPVDGAVVLFPDPMGATGGTICEAVSLYKKNGRAAKYVALHCIVTPEYLRKLTQAHPDVVVYAIRLDRGLSARETLGTLPGTHWDRERGLNDKHYIVPGGGGFGEIMNNAYV
jgi:uracil phosphoribosyltransferase